MLSKILFFLGLSLSFLHQARASCNDQLEVKEGAIGITVRGDGRKLILRRSPTDPTFPLFWSFPGGKLELGETPEEAVAREFHEETGLKVRKVTRLSRHETLVPEKNRLYIVYSFLVEIEDGEVILSSEHDQYRWLNEIESRDLEPMGPVTRAFMVNPVSAD